MTKRTVDPVAREVDQLADQTAQERRAIASAAVDWKTKWPNYCPACKGWGGWWGGMPFLKYHSKDSITAMAYEPCERLPKNACHRCGAAGFVLCEGRESAACTVCGWKPGEDGVPQ
jgi:hypothetical protein